MDLYRMLWSRLGGRPWTYILRDLWHRYEWLWIAGLMLGGYFIGKNGFDYLLGRLFSFTIGYVAGHLFWGKDYVPGQQGDADA
ncbi:hypothetical protein DEALK_00880 [Dehalogenimonas alkenigignens]|uniref:Uncharacterized protein n=1 Tax=Dehalogenimonas alkenigignens TaxID=1217799 RepID=A0A0W0GKX9_9CHLR|nr:hypothetical protein [Dehalogenimonas alkenigignens]KTB49176.1 hypothetical protein DEALK_00880 [Dehalogenimonas alkenigignens]